MPPGIHFVDGAMGRRPAVMGTGLDVWEIIAVARDNQGSPDLRGRPDRVHFASLPDQQRAIVTRDLGDFRPLLADAMRRGTPTYGIVCVPERFPLSRNQTGRLVRALAALLEAHREPDAVIKGGGEIWLEDPAPT